MDDPMNERPDGSAPRVPEDLKPADIDALMALPPRPPPSIIVIGDEAVSAITLPPRPRPPA